MDFGFVEKMENARIEKYLTDTRKLLELTFYGGIVEIDLFDGGYKEAKGFCFFDFGKEALSIFDINTNNPLSISAWKNGIGTFALMRLEEMANERGIKTIYAVDSENDAYWRDRLGFERYPSHLPRTFDGNIDFVKRVNAPPIEVKQKFVPFEVEYTPKGRYSLDLPKFEQDAAKLIGISLEDYRNLDPSEITARLISARKQKNRR